ncbi:lipid droplet-regulating VLDL assembly factor AUP1-like [Homarus americanus]|uniref:lipid droplet-regulating VLDL assembly factor AUP1-like n=1 Tax=Homarus americanus TaxID=6706 RepID=UPI001C48A48A|nr:lipid droplet-regulating VLDL assembly factor AUP1-like [Homarus americanus]
MTVPIEAIYSRNRFPSGPSLLFLLLYTPLGIVLLLLRLFISLQLFLAASVLPHNTIIRRIVLRALYSVLGLVVREEALENRDTSCRIISTNHITPFDHLAVSIVLPCVTPSVYDLPGALSTLLCYHDLGVTQGREVLRFNARTFLSDANSPPLLLHPEGATTSGTLALMKYGTWAFELNGSVLVAGIRVWRLPLLPVAPSILGASWAADLCFMLFSPVTVFTIRYIGKMKRGESETSEEFAARVQVATAVALSVKTSNHTVADKVEYMKRLAREAAAAANPMLSPEVHRMAQQVQEVLPHISLEQIKRDLVHTQNVDLTITNFLEGNVPEPVPEPRPITPSQSPPGPSVHSVVTASSSTPFAMQSHGASLTSNAFKATSEGGTPPGGMSNASVALSTAAKSFGKSASDRMTSFQTRKAQLIENARRKYIEKHGLQIPGYNC